MPNSPSVLIVGAGPTGLMMATILARNGISFRIIDKKPTRTMTTNAAVLHARTLELLDHLGIVDRFISKGNRLHGIRLHAEKETIATASLQQIDSHYQFSWMIPQSETEKILSEYLEEIHGPVERPVELIDLKQEHNQVISTIKLANGETETITSDWVVGCDGLHSLVRQKSQIVFEGEDLPDKFMIADTQMETQLSEDKLDVFMGKRIMAIFPLGQGLYRVVAVSDSDKNTQTDFTEEEIKRMVEERTEGEFRVKAVLWHAPFWIHSKAVDRMREGSVFLAGDAAHVHSPVGGQGMNTGLQDAYNLAWKLVLVIKGQALPSLLDSYQSERLPVIKNLVRMTEAISKVGTTKNWFLMGLRKLLAKFIVGKNKTLQDKITMQVSQLAIRYQNSPVIDERSNLPVGAPAPGERAPDVSHYLYDKWHDLKHHLLLFTGENMDQNRFNDLLKIQQEIGRKYPDIITVDIVGETNFTHSNAFILDPNLVIHKRYHVTKPSMCLVRPDSYIAFFIDRLDQAQLEKFLHKYLKSEKSSP